MSSTSSLGDFLCDSSFWKADYIPVSAWQEHVPFAFWLVDVLRPRTFVELGTHTGCSYLALCQAVTSLALPAKGFAVDTWEGDEQTGFYGEEVLNELAAYHSLRYGALSRLVQSTFDEAVEHFEDESIDLLHIDGLHDYEPVRHDFETWKPKLSSRAVVLFHDTNVHERGFGVHRLWSELRAEHAGFEFVHGHGLGVLGVGGELPPRIRRLVESERDAILCAEIRNAYARLGGACKLAFDLDQTRRLAIHERGEWAVRLEAELGANKELAVQLEAELDANKELTVQLEAELDANKELAVQLEAELSANKELVGRAAAFQARAADLEHQLAILITSESWQITSPLRFVGRRMRLIRATANVASPGRRVTRFAKTALPAPVRMRLRQRFPDAVATLMRPPSPSSGIQKVLLFVSGAPEVSKRYRCDHQAEQLELLGTTVDVATHGEIDLSGVADAYRVFVLHRVPWGDDVAVFLDSVRTLGRVVVFDTDDLVFDPLVIDHVGALADMSKRQVELYEEGLHRYRRTMQASDVVSVSTESLAQLARKVHDRVFVTPNVVTDAMLEAAAAARPSEIAMSEASSATAEGVTIGYLSGTNTHNEDFLEAADALLAVLTSRERTRLRLVGPLRLDTRFDRFGDRIERLPIQSWDQLPAIQAGVDVNLAPLEANNPYTDSKSCVKWLEASLVGVPTVASPRPDFTRVIEHGINGLLADGPTQWTETLSTLVDNPARRRQMGERGRQDVLDLHATRVQALRYRETIRGIVPQPDAPLRINWIMEAPIARNSGGYRNIFRIAHELGSRAHRQRLYINPVAHLSGRSDTEIMDFVAEAFGIPSNAEVVVGHRDLAPADISIATFWTTAYTTAADTQSLFKAYFIQDFEPEFYERTDSHYDRAANTYELPLRHICLGKHLGDRLTRLKGIQAEVVDLALDPTFQLRTRPEDRPDPVRVLFFARPTLRRRGYQLGINALQLVKRAHPEAQIAFFGAASEELGPIPFDVENLGVLNAGDVAEAMNTAHVLVTFSLTNISNVPYEGMACGCAVVDLDIPNVTAMVDNGRNCMLAHPEPDAIARSVIELIENNELRVKLGRQGAEDVRHRTWRRTADMFEESLLRTCFLRGGDDRYG